ncbi:hypothetical protein BC831DRAFT_549208, partial [Entophlyctis helioformis]
MLSEFSVSLGALFSARHGSCLLWFEPLLEPDYTGSSVSVPIVLPFFQSKTSGSLLLSKKERSSLLHRLKGEAIVEFQSVIQRAGALADDDGYLVDRLMEADA